MWCNNIILIFYKPGNIICSILVQCKIHTLLHLFLIQNIQAKLTLKETADTQNLAKLISYSVHASMCVCISGCGVCWCVRA